MSPCDTLKSTLISELEMGGRSELEGNNCGAEEVGIGIVVSGRAIPDLASISVLPATKSIEEGEVTRLKAYGVDAQGGLIDISPFVVWTTASAIVATVNKLGEVTGVGAGGPTNITATYTLAALTPLTDTCAVTVTAP